jgi:DNA polymerase III alpha subunit
VFDSFGERAAILASIERIRSEVGKLSNKHDKNQFSLFDTPTETTNVKPIAPPDKFDQVAPMPEKEKLSLEKELLGVYISENPLSRLFLPFAGIQADQCADCGTKPNEAKVKLIAVVTRIREVVTKKNNSKMAFVTLEDASTSQSGVLFPKTYTEILPILRENQAYYIEGKINIRNDELSIVIDKMTDTPPDTAPKYDFTINIPVQTSQTQLLALNKLLKLNPNSKKGLIIMANGKQIPLSYGVNYTQALKDKIDEILNP